MISKQSLDRVLQVAKTDTDAGRRISAAIALIEHVLDDLGEQAIAISFNGGKDCTVLLHLYAAVLYARHSPTPPSQVSQQSTSQSPGLPIPNGSSRLNGEKSKRIPKQPAETTSETVTDIGKTSNGHDSDADNDENEHASSSTSHLRTFPAIRAEHIPPPPSTLYPPIKAIYITAPNPFPTLDAFVHASAGLYGMDLFRFGGGMKAALADYLGCTAGKGVEGMLMGTRKGDPNGDVKPLAPTDPSWPRILRIHPILDWTYTQVWDFLRELDVPYCTLYDEGYTSLGSTTNTVPNPLLRNPSVPGGWDPAWKLQDGSKERCGRLDSSS